MAERWMLENNLATKATECIIRGADVPAAQLSSDDLLENLREPFVRWLGACCVCRPRCFGGLTCLHLEFCLRCIATGIVPCDREMFLSLLLELGFLTGDVNGVSLVAGLILKSDLEAHEQFERGRQ